MDEELKNAIIKYVDQLQRGQQGQAPLIVLVNIESPITLNTSPLHDGWLERKLRIFESSSVRIAVVLISFITLIGIVTYKLGVPWPFSAHADSVIPTEQVSKGRPVRMPSGDAPVSPTASRARDDVNVTPRASSHDKTAQSNR